MKSWWAILWPFLINFEGFRSKPYRDQRGIWTIGYGTTRYPDGRKVGPNDPAIDPHTAEKYMMNSVDKVYDRIKVGIKHPATEHQIAAFVSLAYNIGCEAFLGSSLLAAHNSGAPANVIEEDFTKWDKTHIHGSLEVVQGLYDRREAEYAIYKTPDA